jgi:hypothetical protein
VTESPNAELKYLFGRIVVAICVINAATLGTVVLGLRHYAGDADPIKQGMFALSDAELLMAISRWIGWTALAWLGIALIIWAAAVMRRNDRRRAAR